MPDKPQLTDFLNSLAEDPDEQLLFEQEPVAIMTRFGLAESQQLLILEGSVAELRAAITEELDSVSATVLFVLRIKK